MEPLLLTKREASEMLGVSIRSIEYMIRDGRLQARQMGRRRLVVRTSLVKISRSDVQRISPPDGSRQAVESEGRS